MISIFGFFRFRDILMHVKASTFKLNQLFAWFQTKAKNWQLLAILEIAEKDQLFVMNFNHFWFTLRKVTCSLIFTCLMIIAKTEVGVQEAIFVNPACFDLRGVIRYHIDTIVFSIQSLCKPKGLALLTSEKHGICERKRFACFNRLRLSTERNLPKSFYLLRLRRKLEQR